MELSFIASVFISHLFHSKTVEQTGKIHLLLKRTYLGNYFLFFLKAKPIHLLAHPVPVFVPQSG
jgi:hypothetical protein